GRSGPALVPGDPDKSLLVRALRHTKDVEPMPPPPNKKVSDETIADFALWVKSGAPWPAKLPPNTFKAKKHWAFEPLQKVPPPDDPRFAHPIDRFMAATWAAKGVSPVERADPRTLARRVYFDLIGLPPTPEEIDAFVNDASPDALTRLIDRLL